MFVLRIITAWWYWILNRNDEEAKRRVLICGDCPKMKWGVCTCCGCPIITKSRLLDETCPHPDGDKWAINKPEGFQSPG